MDQLVQMYQSLSPTSQLIALHLFPAVLVTSVSLLLRQFGKGGFDDENKPLFIPFTILIWIFAFLAVLALGELPVTRQIMNVFFDTRYDSVQYLGQFVFIFFIFAMILTIGGTAYLSHTVIVRIFRLKSEDGLEPKARRRGQITPNEVLRTATTRPAFESPIEELFWDAWQKSGGASKLDLTYQYKEPNTRYRIDFVHLPTKTAIEIDGYKYHSSKERFIADKKRQRKLERLGWRFIRFSGTEVYEDPGECFDEVVEFTTMMQSSRYNLAEADAKPVRFAFQSPKPRSRDEIIDLLYDTIDNWTIDTSRLELKTPYEMTEEELYNVASREIYSSETSNDPYPAGRPQGVWEFWLKIIEDREKERFRLY